jgi:SEC-C motif
MKPKASLASLLSQVTENNRHHEVDTGPAVGGEIRRNDPCPCGSGRKYKNCCMSRAQPKDQQPLSPQFRFEPGSYGGDGRFIPSIACLKQIALDQWDYHFVIVKLERVYPEKDMATLEATRDLDAAFAQRRKSGSDYTVAEYLRTKGYFSVTNFQTAKGSN